MIEEMVVQEEKEIVTTIMTKKRFSTMIEKKVKEFSMPYIDAVLGVCEDRELQPEDVARLISPQIKEKIEAEAIRVNAIKGNSIQLDI